MYMILDSYAMEYQKTVINIILTSYYFASTDGLVMKITLVKIVYLVHWMPFHNA